MLSSKTVANRFIQLAAEEQKSFTPLQLQKLVFLAHGWLLGLDQKPLIKDEIQAWPYGPVIPRLYNVLRRYRDNAVDKPISAADEQISEREDDIIKQVYDIYGGLSGSQLSRITHEKNSPWDQIYKLGTWGVAIPEDLILGYFTRLAKKP